MDLLQLTGTLISGTLILLVYTFLWKDNRLFRFAEHLFVGVTAAHALVVGIDNINRLAVKPVLAGMIIYTIPLILGLMLYFHFSKQYSYLTRIPIALLVGIATGLTVRGQVSGVIYAQVMATAKLPLITNNLLTSINNIIIVTGTIAVMSFFIFTRHHTGLLKYSSAYGRYIIMAALGASYGSAVLIRMSLLGGNLQTLLRTDFIYVVPVVIVLFAAWVAYSRRLEKKAK
jgi:uncharacterized membrane protein (UPF0136 family)